MDRALSGTGRSPSSVPTVYFYLSPKGHKPKKYSLTMKELYDEHKSEDGFLHLYRYVQRKCPTRTGILETC